MNLAAGQCVYGREPVGKCLKGCQIIGQRVVETFSSVPSLSRRDLFYDLSTRESCPLRIPLDELGAAVSPADKS